MQRPETTPSGLPLRSATLATLAVLTLLSAATPCTAGDDPPALKLRSVTLRAGQPAPPVPARLAAPAEAEGGTVLVQFSPGSTPAGRRALVESLGGRFGPYIPDHGALVHLPPGALGALRALPGIVLAEPLAPAWKIDPSAENLSVPADLMVSLHPWSDRQAVLEGIAAAGASLLLQPSGAITDPTFKVSVGDRQAVESLARLPGIRWIEAAVPHRLLNDRSRWTVQSNQDGSFPLHDHGLRGQDQVLAGMDSGLDKGHCCYDGKRVDNYSSFGNGDRSDGCDVGHGTHVFATAGCAEPAGIYDGIAPEITFVVQDIQQTGPFSCGWGAVSPPSDLRDAFLDALNRGARVHTNSWGGGNSSYNVESQQIDDFVWNHQDFLILFAAGNSGGGQNSGTISNQAAAKNSVTVGGTESAPRQEYLYNSSSKGPSQDGRRKPEITAPATRPATGGPAVTSADNDTSCGFVAYSGTSMATPAVAGASILVRQYFLEGFHPGGTANPADSFAPAASLVKAMLIASADNMTGTDVCGPRPNTCQGWGRINLDTALPFAGDPETLLVLDDRDTATGFDATGQETVFEVYVPDAAQALKAVLVWTDPPAAPGAIPSLINDLDLTVELRGGLLYTGSAAYEGGWSQPAGSPADRYNNHEAVMIAAPQPGNATVRVRAHQIGDAPGHPQDYSLVLVGGASGGPCTDTLPVGTGDSLRIDRSADDTLLSWNDTGSDHYHVYRDEAPASFGEGLAVHADFVTDQDPGTSGVQWTDGGGANGAGAHHYVVRSANSCHDEAP